MADERQDADDDAREAARQRRIADACLLDAPVPGRLGLYRKLVQGNLAAVVRRLVPRTAAALDRAEEQGFAEWFARFLADAGPRTPYLRDVPGEFVAWAGRLWPATTLPPFVGDLARYEIDLFELDAAPAAPPLPTLGDVALDRRLVFASPHTLARYEHAVHEPAKDIPGGVTFILMHRDAENAVHSTVLDAPIAHLIRRTLDGLTLGDALAAAPGENDPLDVARWLADLGAKGALLGGEG
jgi:hypothetical protein